MAYDNNVILKASAAITTTTTGSEVNLGTRTVQPMVFVADVTEKGADASEYMDLEIQDCATSSGTFTTLVKFPRITAVGQYFRKAYPRQYVKIYATTGGTTPTFTTAVNVAPAGRDTKF